MIRSSLTQFLLIISFGSFGQMEDYTYRRPIEGVEDQWHRIRLPNEVLSKMHEPLHDLRIYGINSKGDTIEAPYLWDIDEEEVVTRTVKFNQINTAVNSTGSFFTFEIPQLESINQIQLSFAESNFDWMIQLEGSQEQTDWFTLLDEYRIVSIKNNSTDYTFSRLDLPEAKYRYYRLLVKKAKANLLRASITKYEMVGSRGREYKVKGMKVFHDRESRITNAEIELDSWLPVRSVEVFAEKKFDYYRPIDISYLSDSVKRDTFYLYDYAHLTTGILSSLDSNRFSFPVAKTKRLRLSVHNYDNQPINLVSVLVKGYDYNIIARFLEPAEYYLCYGKPYASAPIYDIERFSSAIPGVLTPLTLGKESSENMVGRQASENEPLSKWWLWSILIVVIVVLGGFTFKMLRQG